MITYKRNVCCTIHKKEREKYDNTLDGIKHQTQAADELTHFQNTLTPMPKSINKYLGLVHPNVTLICYKNKLSSVGTYVPIDFVKSGKKI